MITWADRTWPYVNGKALMSGIRLTEMEASDMVDVLHFLFEEDFTSVSEEHARSRSAIREVLYGDMYGVDYTFRLKDREGKASTYSASQVDDSFDDEFGVSLGSATPFDPRKQETKPFIPATEFDGTSDKPFEGLDGPLG